MNDGNEILDSMLKVVYFVDDENREPYLVHCEVENGYCVLGLKDYPDTPQDFETPRERVGEKISYKGGRNNSKNKNSKKIK